MLHTLVALFEALPEEERPLAEQYLRHQLVLLSCMPESQRYEEYAKADMAMAHHARFAERAERAEVPPDHVSGPLPVAVPLHLRQNPR